MAWVQPEEIAYANYLIRLEYLSMKAYQSLSLPVKPAKTRGTPRTRLFAYMPEVTEAYTRYVNNYLKKITELRKHVTDEMMRFAEKYWHMAYAVASPLITGASLVFIAYPPQITTMKQHIMHPSGYINVNFIPTKLTTGKTHKTVIARYFYSYYWNNAKYHLKSYLEEKPRLKTFYENKIQQYTARGKTEVHARKLARRDLARIHIGNVWLVGIYHLWKKGEISEKDIILPYELAQNPQLHRDYFNPIETVKVYRLPEEVQSEIKDITWKWLLEVKNII